MTHINTVLVHFRADTSECTRKGGTNWVAMHKLSPIPPFFQTSLSQSAAIHGPRKNSKGRRVGAGAIRSIFPTFAVVFQLLFYGISN